MSNAVHILSCRGRGSRTVLKWLKNGTVVHDASYFTPVELDGPEVQVSLCSFLALLISYFFYT